MKKDKIAGSIILGVFALVEIVFMGVLFYVRMIPVLLWLGIGFLLFLLAVMVGVLTLTTKKKVSFVMGIILAIISIIIFVLGGTYILNTTSTLSDVSGIKTEIAQVGIYVREEDSAKTIKDTEVYNYGILKELDRANTDQTVTEIEKELGCEIQHTEYKGITQLVDGLLNGETGAIVLNHAYLSVLEEVDGYADVTTKIREISVKNVETEIKEKAKAENGEVMTVYISGIDNRGEIVASSRSDVNIIAVANLETKQLLLVSTPRDYFVPLSISDGVPDKLTHAGIYGVNVSMDTLGMLYDTEIHNYFRLNFAGFQRIVDALGGITVVSDYDFDSQNSEGFHFTQGENQMNGEQALAFSRERYAFQEGDRQRGKNQMAVIKGVVKKAMSPALLRSYSEILASVEGSFETNLSYEEIGKLIQKQLTNSGEWNIVSYSVDGTGDTLQPYSMSVPAYVMIPNEATVTKAKELMQKVRNGEVISQEDLIVTR